METQKMTAKEIIESLEYTAKFIPWSQSRSAKENPKLADYNLNWIVSIKRGRVEVSTDYTQGIGHLPGWKHNDRGILSSHYHTLEDCVERGEEFRPVFTDWGGKLGTTRGRTLSAPDIKDVLHCLLMDSDALNYASFDEWADCFGPNPDSRKDEKIYQACLKIALQVKQLFTPAELETLEEFFQDY